MAEVEVERERAVTDGRGGGLRCPIFCGIVDPFWQP